MQESAETAIRNYVAKLDSRAKLPPEARAALLAVELQSKTFGTYHDIVQEGDRNSRSCLVHSGMVSRYKTLNNGTRQILSFHFAGDMVDLQSALIMVADHGIRTHEPTTIVSLAHTDILRLAAEHPSLARAFWFDTLLDAAIFREWTVNVGRRNARQRTAHLLLEFAVRLKAVGLVKDNTFTLNVSQNDLSDALGITSVHLNRTLQWLRGERLIRTHSRSITIENWPEMIALAGFDRTYLHPEGPREPA